MSARGEADNDWLLYCGGWRVGRIHRPGGRLAPVYAWDLTGQTDVQLRAETPDLAVAKDQMIAAMRRWAIWAGLRQPGGGGPVTPRWVLAKDHAANRSMEITCDPDTYWLMISGHFVAGRIYRPDTWQRTKLTWQLLTSGPMQGPNATMGEVDTVDEGKLMVLVAWRAWLAWAELAS
jgi:hypothetical protein